MQVSSTWTRLYKCLQHLRATKGTWDPLSNRCVRSEKTEDENNVRTMDTFNLFRIKWHVIMCILKSLVQIQTLTLVQVTELISIQYTLTASVYQGSLLLSPLQPHIMCVLFKPMLPDVSKKKRTHKCICHSIVTLHWQSVHSVPCLTQEEPLKRVTPCSSVHVLVMSLRMVSAWHGSVTQRAQHSPSGTIVKSQSTEGQERGQQSTSPCCNRYTQKALTQQHYTFLFHYLIVVPREKAIFVTKFAGKGLLLLICLLASQCTGYLVDQCN